MEEHEQPAPLPAFRGNPCKGNIKGHGKNDQKHQNTTHSGLYFMPVVLASVRSPLWVRGRVVHALAGCLDRPQRRHKPPQYHTLCYTNKGTKPMPCPRITSPPLLRVQGRGFLAPRALAVAASFPSTSSLLRQQQQQRVPCPFPSRHSSYLGMRANSKRGQSRRPPARRAPTSLP